MSNNTYNYLLSDLKNLKGVANAKSEIVNNIIEGGSIILTADDKFFKFLISKSRKRKLKLSLMMLLKI